jgi:hypothetical protein
MIVSPFERSFRALPLSVVWREFPQQVSLAVRRVGWLMLEVRGWIDGGRLTASAQSLHETVALAMEWQNSECPIDVTICDGSASFTVAAFSWMIAFREIEHQALHKQPSSSRQRMH